MKEPKSVKDALQDEYWSKAMEEEIEKIEKNKTWNLVPDQKKRMWLAPSGYSETN